MADTYYTIYSGFYDSMGKDRLYSADDMNRPYKSIISEGIFSIDDDFAVVPSSGMVIQMKAGIALLGDRWIDASTTLITVPENAGLQSRTDSVILQINNEDDVRAGRIVYRTGVADGSGEYPGIITGNDDIHELILATVTVAAGATSIAAGNISSKRGTIQCPYAKFIVGASQIEESVESVLEDHPEWTTTVEDGSISMQKLASDVTGNILSTDIKNALLQIAAKVAYIDEHGQDYYDALYNALYPPANLVSISAVYTQSGTVYDTDSLDDLKSDLVVTATYSDSSTETVTTYTLSGTLAVGTSTITVSYGGKTDTFNVTVTHYDASLYNWDFTQSLTDSKQGVTVTLPDSGATQSSAGLVITSLSAPITCATVSTTTLGQFTVEWDITTFGWSGGTGNKSLAYVARAASQLQGVMYRGSVPAWALRDLGGTYYNLTDFSDATMFNGKTLKLQVDQTVSNTWKLYCDDVLIGTQTVGTYSGSILIGFRDTGTFTGLRIYEGLV